MEYNVRGKKTVIYCVKCKVFTLKLCTVEHKISVK